MGQLCVTFFQLQAFYFGNFAPDDHVIPCVRPATITQPGGTINEAAHRLRNRHRGDELEQLWRDFSSELMLNWEEVLRLEEQQALLDKRLVTLFVKYGFDGCALLRVHPP